MWDAGHGYGGMMGFGGIFGLLFWIFLIIVAVALIKWLFFRTIDNNESGNSSAMDILNQRFAAGEITEEEYLRIKKRIANDE